MGCEGRTCRLMTSSLVAGVLDTRCTQSWPSSVHSRGGSTLSRISSVCWFFCASTGGSLDFGGLGIGPPPPMTATVGCWPCLERDWKRREKSEKQYVSLKRVLCTLFFLSVVLLTSTGLSYFTRGAVAGIMLILANGYLVSVVTTDMRMRWAVWKVKGQNLNGCCSVERVERSQRKFARVEEWRGREKRVRATIRKAAPERPCL